VVEDAAPEHEADLVFAAHRISDGEDVVLLGLGSLVVGEETRRRGNVRFDRAPVAR
jgi:hypothetical protein